MFGCRVDRIDCGIDRNDRGIDRNDRGIDQRSTHKIRIGLRIL